MKMLDFMDFLYNHTINDGPLKWVNHDDIVYTADISGKKLNAQVVIDLENRTVKIGKLPPVSEKSVFRVGEKIIKYLEDEEIYMDKLAEGCKEKWSNDSVEKD